MLINFHYLSLFGKFVYWSSLYLSKEVKISVDVKRFRHDSVRSFWIICGYSVYLYMHKCNTCVVYKGCPVLVCSEHILICDFIAYWTSCAQEIFVLLPCSVCYLSVMASCIVTYLTNPFSSYLSQKSPCGLK